MNNAIQDLLFQAAFRAAMEMGEELRQMSCFFEHWNDVQAEVDDTLPIAA